MNNQLTRLDDTNIYTLYNLNDRDLYHTCITNKYFLNLCQNDVILKTRLNNYLYRYNNNINLSHRNRFNRFSDDYYGYESPDTSEEEVYSIYTDDYKKDVEDYYQYKLNKELGERHQDEDYYDVEDTDKYHMTRQELDEELNEIARNIKLYKK